MTKETTDDKMSTVAADESGTDRQGSEAEERPGKPESPAQYLDK